MEIDRSNSSVTCGWLKFTVTTETVFFIIWQQIRGQGTVVEQ
jgi:hypothetical protein